MKFCPQCGHKKNENGNFCVSCGCNLSENQTLRQDQNQLENNSSPIKVKKKNRWIWISVLLLIVSIGIYGVYEESLYPKSKLELENLLCDKFWKVTEAKIKEVYVDDVLVPEPTQNIRKNLEKSFSENPINEYSSMYTLDLLKDHINMDEYITFSSSKKLCSDSNLWYYSKNYDNSISEYIIANSCLPIRQSNGRFLMNIPPMAQFRNDNYELFVDEIERVYYNLVIDKITSNSLQTIEDFSYKIGGKKIRMVISIVYSPYSPIDKKRYEETKNDIISETEEGDIFNEQSEVMPTDSF
jgi:hypothetical protein